MTDIIGHRFPSWLVPEPLLEFGNCGMNVDPKTGLELHGPFATVRSIRLGIIGSGETIGHTLEWIERSRSRIKGVPEQPYLFPDFPGINSALPFSCEVDVKRNWQDTIAQSAVDRLLHIQDRQERVTEAAKLLSSHMRNLGEIEPRPDVVIVALPQEVVDYCATSGLTGGQGVRIRLTNPERKFIGRYKRAAAAGQGQFFSIEELLGLTTDPRLQAHYNLRRAFKADVMSLNIPTQIMRPNSLVGGEDTQDDATRAWNFWVGVYHKAGGIPWRLARAESGSCYVGITFYQERKTLLGGMRTSLAQIFTHRGEGLVLKGERFQWDEKKGRTPHLPRPAAEKLLTDVIEAYQQKEGQLPRRVVVHKSSRYWNDELDGFKTALGKIPEWDLVTIERRGIRLIRAGDYPPLRGTVARIGNRNYLIYTRGFVPFLQTYPGAHVPSPLEVVEHHGDSTPQTICEEIIGLTKMNWNSADFSSGFPITMAFSRRVGEILAEADPDQSPSPLFRFYI